MPQIRRLLIAFILIVIPVFGCSEKNPDSVLDPETGRHQEDWLTLHRVSAVNLETCGQCHGGDLTGGISDVSCFTASFRGASCHAEGPLKAHPIPFAEADEHGPEAKKDLLRCQGCHGTPGTVNFNGGLSIVACTTCHPAAGAHPTDWQGSGAFSHRTANNINTACAICHNVNAATPAGAEPRAPSCFSGIFTNANGQSRGCHALGPGKAAPHPVPFASAALHGPSAKRDLVFCQSCHGTPGGAGSNPSFNVPIGNLLRGCEDCHAPRTAHPVPWRGPSSTSHQSSGNMALACGLCHGATLNGGVGPACTVCHTSGSPLVFTVCASCHGSPPTGAAFPNIAGTHAGHNALPFVTNICGTCHNGAGTGTTVHFNQFVDVSIFAAYNAKSGAASYIGQGRTCANVSCHGGQTTPDWRLTDSIDVNTQCGNCHAGGDTQFNSYFSGEHNRHVTRENISCTQCHDAQRLQAGHFTRLNTTAMEGPASATLRNELQYNGVSCNPRAGGLTGCHGGEDWF